MTHHLRIGLKLRPERYSIDQHRRSWEIADEAGFDHVWSYDHLVAVGRDDRAPIFEGWTLITAAAATTQRVHVGLIVTSNLFRHPAQLAKIAVTVDHVSRGRLEMGIGAGWPASEFDMFGIRCPPVAERLDRLDESIAVIKSLWTQPTSTFDGRYYQLHGAIAEPKPVQRPHPPIWIGGSGPKRTLRLVATHADVWNSNCKTFDEDVAAAAILDEHCAALGRDPATVRRSVHLYWKDLDTACSEAESYLRAGFTELIINLHPDRLPENHDPVAASEQIAAEALPRLRTLG